MGSFAYVSGVQAGSLVTIAWARVFLQHLSPQLSVQPTREAAIKRYCHREKNMLSAKVGNELEG